MGYIDAHVHVWTPNTAHYPLAAGFKKEDMAPRSFTPEDLFEHTRTAGVDRVNLMEIKGERSPSGSPLRTGAYLANHDLRELVDPYSRRMTFHACPNADFTYTTRIRSFASSPIVSPSLMTGPFART
jgi:hypothetical protein